MWKTWACRTTPGTASEQDHPRGSFREGPGCSPVARLPPHGAGPLLSLPDGAKCGPVKSERLWTLKAPHACLLPFPLLICSHAPAFKEGGLPSAGPVLPRRPSSSVRRNFSTDAALPHSTLWPSCPPAPRVPVLWAVPSPAYCGAQNQEEPRPPCHVVPSDSGHTTMWHQGRFPQGPRCPST